MPPSHASPLVLRVVRSGGAGLRGVAARVIGLTAVAAGVAGAGAIAAVGTFGVAIVRSLAASKLRSLPNLVRGLRAAPNTRGFRSWPADAQDTYVQMMNYYDVHGLPAGDFGDLPKILPRQAIGYEQFAHRIAVAHGIAAP